MIKALVFDIGGVLFLPLNNQREKSLLDSFGETMFLLDSYMETNLEIKELLREVYKQSAQGIITKQETLQKMSNILGIGEGEVESIFRKIYSEKTVENIELYEKIILLKMKNYKIGILSTQFHLSKDVLVPKKYYDNFDALGISCDDKLKKPDEKAFTTLLQSLNVLTEDVLFVDDQQKNIDAATSLGMQAVLFKNNKQLFQTLEELGVK